jgi:1-acyl-sn-glycerol-3-phosphate acyltransferase
LRCKNGEQLSKNMKFIWPVINIIQIILVLLWTGVCGIVGMLLMLITWNGIWVHKVNGLYMWSPMVRFITGVSVVVHGREKVNKNGCYIYVANHESHFDILAMASAMPIGLFFVGKKELARIPIMGQYMRLIGHIFVDRKNSESALKSMRLAAEKIKAGKNVISFPEGTRSKTGELMMFKRGAFMIAKEGKVGVVPIGIIGSRKILASGKFNIRPGAITVRIGDPIEPDIFESMTVEQIAALARERVAALIAQGV